MNKLAALQFVNRLGSFIAMRAKQADMPNPASTPRSLQGPNANMPRLGPPLAPPQPPPPSLGPPGIGKPLGMPTGGALGQGKPGGIQTPMPKYVQDSGPGVQKRWQEMMGEQAQLKGNQQLATARGIGAQGKQNTQNIEQSSSGWQDRNTVSPGVRVIPAGGNLSLGGRGKGGPGGGIGKPGMPQQQEMLTNGVALAPK